MRRTILATLLLLLAAPLLQGDAPADATRLTLRDEFLRRINRDRVQFDLAPVKLDSMASSVADAYCR